MFFPNRNPTQAPSEKDASTKHFKMRLLVAVCRFNPGCNGQAVCGEALTVHTCLWYVATSLGAVAMRWARLRTNLKSNSFISFSLTETQPLITTYPMLRHFSSRF